MAKEVTLYEAADGKQFKTKQGAQNYDKRLLVKAKQEELGMTKDEITAALEKTANHNFQVKVLLKSKNWTDWPIHLIKLITKELLSEPDKKTLYVKEYRSWGETKEKELALEKGDNFADPELHVGEGPEMYKVVKTEEVDKYTLKVFYDSKYDTEEKISMKLESGEKLDESEIAFMVHNLEKIHEEEGDEGRWDRQMSTVVKLEENLYAIDWSRGLTESQENVFSEQPYKVKVETKEVVVKTTVVTPL